jgi:Flp pilus assembly protein TadG
MSRLLRLLSLARRLRRDRQGAATIEFAIWGSFFFIGMLTALDFGMWQSYRLRLSSAVEQGSILAFNGRAALDQAVATEVGSYVAAAARLPAPGVVSVVTGCNGGTANCVATSRTCACLGRVGTTNSYAAATCGAPCPGGSTAGYYMTIRASYPYKAVVLPQNLLNGRSIVDNVVVRLQ